MVLKKNGKMKALLVASALIVGSTPAFAAGKGTASKTTQSQRDFKEAMDVALPLSPSEIRQLKKRSDSVERAMAHLPAPKNNGIRDIHLIPGAAIPSIDIVGGYITNILFYDESGNPIPIEVPGAASGNSDAYRVETYNNIVQVSVDSVAYQSTNLTVPLAGLPFPAMFVLNSVKKASEGRLDQIVKVYIRTGAGKSVPEIRDENNVSALMRLLNGLPADGFTPLSVRKTEVAALDNPAVKLNTRGDFAKFFKEDATGNTFIILNNGFRLGRTYDLLTRQTGADGTTGYVMPPSNASIYTVTDNNRIFYLTLDRGL